ncbi:MAG: squalene/phytoene synthase family protein [Proteobacteria bacterium]|nr:squalene/phytoene synthase family protein [Pseudomonadota bacterium]
MTEPAADPAESLDAKIARVDPNRWLSSRFVADEEMRSDLITLYAFDHELARIPGSVKQALLGEIRVAWWREGLDEVFEGKPARAHPTLQALAETIARRRLPKAPFEAMLDARTRELEPEPFADEAGLNAWLDQAHGSVMAQAVAVLDPKADQSLGEQAARAWGLGVLARQGRLTPADWTPEAVEAKRREALARARVQAAKLPASAFPAVAHASLSGPIRRGTLATRLKLVWSVATGRV